MPSTLGPGLLRDLTEAKADLTRHGIVLIRMIETDIEPAIVVQARASLSSSPNRLAKMKENDLDELMDGVRKAAMRSSTDLRKLYTRLLATVGDEDIGKLVSDLEGIGELFKWDRVAKVVEPVNEKLADRGFGQISLADPGEVSEAFRVELEQKWPAAFGRFKTLVEEASAAMKAQEEEEKARGQARTQKRPAKKR